MERNVIVKEIQSLAAELQKVPGERTFTSTTGIKRSELWAAGFAKYTDAVKAAGLTANALNSPLDKSILLERLAELTHELRRFPTKGDIKVQRSKDASFPSYEAYFRLGGNAYKQVPRLLLEYCTGKNEFAGILELIREKLPQETGRETANLKPAQRVTGYVYLLKLGADYKIGRSNDVARRKREITLMLPQDLEHIHTIETDDPVGIERYWHKRFDDCKTRGEWFRLSRQDVTAFKRRKYQ